MGVLNFEGRCDGKDSASKSKLRIRLDADEGDVLVGGDDVGGDVKVKDHTNAVRIRLDAGGRDVQAVEAATETIVLAGASGTITAGGHGRDGSLLLKGSSGESRIALNGNGQMQVGGSDSDGRISLLAGAVERIQLDARGGNIWLGGQKVNGDLLLLPAAFEGERTANKATIRLDAETSSIRLREPEADGNPRDRIHLDAGEANIWAGGNDKDGDLLLFDKEGDNQSTAQATIWLNGSTGNILLRHRNDKGNLEQRIHLLAESGDITLHNGDCAEDFDIAGSEEIEPGTVMVLDQEGNLQPSATAYDKKVAGVISGAGEYKPGIVLDKRPSEQRRLPVALLGKVYCKVDAQYSSIEVGDLLTTSATPGLAMKATDPLKAFGAVIGKALRPLQSGTGLIPILIALQ